MPAKGLKRWSFWKKSLHLEQDHPGMWSLEDNFEMWCLNSWVHDRRASPTFLLTHRFHALSDSLIRSGGEGCLEFLKEFHALDVVVVAELCHHVFSSCFSSCPRYSACPWKGSLAHCSPSRPSPPGHKVSDFASSRPKLFMFSCFSSVLSFVVASRAGCSPRLGRCGKVVACLWWPTAASSG